MCSLKKISKLFWKQDSWGLQGQDPGGPHVGPMILAIWVAYDCLLAFLPVNLKPCEKISLALSQ